MADLNHHLSSILTESGISQLKAKLEQLLNNPDDTLVLVFDHFEDQANLPFEIPVGVKREGAEYIITLAESLLDEARDCKIQGLPSEIKQLEIRLKETLNEIESFLLQVETELESIRDRVSDELAKIPYRIEIRDASGVNEFFINQTGPVEAKLHGAEINVLSSSLTFTAAEISQLECTVELLLPGLKADNGTDPHKVELSLAYGNGIFNGTANNIPAARLQGFQATITEVTLIIEAGEFKTGTSISGDLVFDFLDDGQSGPGQISFSVELQNDGDVRYSAQNPEGQELRKGSVQVFFRQIEIITHTDAPTDVDINGWLQLAGVVNSAGDPVNTDFTLNYTDPHVEFVGSNFVPVPVGFGSVEFSTILLKIHKNGNLEESNWQGELSLPYFDDGALDFAIEFEDAATDRLKIEVSNEEDKLLKKGDFELLLDQYEMLYQNGTLQNITGSGELKIPLFTNNERINLALSYQKSASNEIVKLEAGNFGSPEIIGLQVDFSKVLFHFLNGSLQTSDLEGRILLPDTTDGAGLAFDIEILNEGVDYKIKLDEAATDNELVFGPIKLEVESFLLEVKSKAVDTVSGAGKLALPGLSNKFDFNFDVTVNGSSTQYRVEIANVSAEISGFELTFSQIILTSQGGQQFTASAEGSLVLPVFEEGAGLDFDVVFSTGKSYEIKVASSSDLVKFGDFELTEVALDLEVDQGELKDFSAQAKLKIPSFGNPTSVSFNYTKVDQKYLISLTQALQIDFFGGSLELATLQIDIRNKQLHEGKASGNFTLPESTGGAGISFEMVIGPDGKSYTLELDGASGNNTIEFGELELDFESFELEVKNQDLYELSGAGKLKVPGLRDEFDFSISFEKSGEATIFKIEVTEVATELESFELEFDLIKIETHSVDGFSSEINGDLTLPVFDGAKLGFAVVIDPAESEYEVAIDGDGQSTQFGMFVLSDVVLSIKVEDGAVKDAEGQAKFHIPELTQPDSPFAISLDYSKAAKEIFELKASNLPKVDLAIFELIISDLSFKIEDGGFESGNLSGDIQMPLFNEGAALDFAFEVSNQGNTYTINIVSTGEISAGALTLDDIAIAVAVNNGVLQGLSGTAKFKLPGAEEFAQVTVTYHQPTEKITFSAQSPPPLTLGDLVLTFTQFGFGIQNGALVEADFAGSLEFPAFDDTHNTLAFVFELTDSDSYSIEANPGDEITQLKVGDISLLIENFNLEIENGELDRISAAAGLRFAALENEAGDGPAELGINFDYEKDEGKYQIGLKNSQPIKVGGFEFTIEKLLLSFTADEVTYPFNFEGKLKIPGLVNADDDPAEVGVKFSVTDAGSWSGSIHGDAEFSIGSVKITILNISIEKTDKVKIELLGKLELEGLTGMGGEPASIEVNIKIDSDGAFSILGEVEGNDAIKVVDAPNIVRIYLSKIGLSRTSTNDWDFLLGGLIQNEIVIPGMDDLLPKEIVLRELNISADFGLDMDLRWPSGLSISFGSDEGEVLIPVNGKFGNAVSLDALKVTFKDKGAQGLDFGLAFSGASIQLGPVAASVEGLGIEANIQRATFVNGQPQGSANFGIVNVVIDFKPPTGLGVSLDTPVFTGGGYLFFDSEKGEYAGAVELSFMNLFAVSAIGIINNKMPDGQPGTSVLFIVSVEFGTGIALGFGFFLSGLGGILGIHRTIQVERLRDGVRAGTIQNILFPKDIIANINKILTDIKEVFPVKRDQFVLGPMAAITWGVPTILRVDLGVVIEFANPVRFGILGVLRVILPDENAALIKIQVAFLGLIDFEKGMLSFDASLFDSKVLTFGLEGDMVLRISWGQSPDFVLSVGGFHPRFSPPTHLQIPTMKRLTLKILSGNPRLTLTCYFAVTSNTVQFGAGIDFYFGVAGFKVVGEFGFDVLFQFSPFRFIADARARLAVKAGSTTLLSLSLEFSLEGPTPWRAKGTAKFKILFFSVKVRFDVTWGDKRDTTLPNIDVFPLLYEAVDDDQNWRSITGNVQSPGLRMKGLAGEEGLILTSNGSIEISQKIVPLKVEISKFGQFSPGDFTEFEVLKVRFGSTDIDVNYITDSFAPANFLDLSDADKLSLPSFNDQNSGVSLRATDDMQAGTVMDREVEYEQLIMDETNSGPKVTRLPSKHRFQMSEVTFFSRTGAIRKSALSASRSRVINDKKVVLKKPKYSVVNTNNLNALENAAELSYMEAVQFAKAADITGKQSIQVVSSDVLAL